MVIDCMDTILRPSSDVHTLIHRPMITGGVRVTLYLYVRAYASIGLVEGFCECDDQSCRKDPRAKADDQKPEDQDDS